MNGGGADIGLGASGGVDYFVGHIEKYRSDLYEGMLQNGASFSGTVYGAWGGQVSFGEGVRKHIESDKAGKIRETEEHVGEIFSGNVTWGKKVFSWGNGSGGSSYTIRLFSVTFNVVNTPTGPLIIPHFEK